MSSRFDQAVRLIDEVNAGDPRTELHDGRPYPKELLYGRRMSDWLDRLEPNASEELRLAARAQHVRRWEIPRDTYPEGREGYRTWRTDLGKFHAETAAAILTQVGYGEQTIGRVRSLLRKERLKTDPDCQLLEDVICLVFLENHFEDFARRHDEEKLLNVIRRTWKKMSERGRKAALGLQLPESLRALLKRALA